MKISEQILSPAQIEFWLAQKERQLIKFLARRTKYWDIFFLAIVIGSLLIWYSESFSPKNGFRANGGYGIVRLIRFVVGWLILLSPLPLFFKEQYRKMGLFFITLFGWGIVTYHYFADLAGPAILILVYISLPLQLVFSYYFLSQRLTSDRSKSPLAFYAIVFFAIEGLISYWIFQALNEKKLLVFWNFKIQFVFLSTVGAYFFSNDRKKFAEVFLVPANCLIGFIWPTSSELCSNDFSEKKRLWVHGMMNIILGYLVIGIRSIFEIEIYQTMSPGIARYMSIYILAILGIIGHLNILAGVARIYGLKVIDATKYIFLSRSPAEYWRRGVVYHYHFIRNFILLSVYRRIKLMSLAVFLGFGFFLVKKIGVTNYSLFINEFFKLGFFNSEFDHTQRELFALIQWSQWFLLLLLSPYLFGRAQLFENKFKAWFSIFMTHALMALTYYLTHVLQALALSKKIFF